MTATLPVAVLAAEPLDTPGGLNSYVRDLLPALAAHQVPALTVVDRQPSASLLPRLLAFRRDAAQAAREAVLVDAHFALYAAAALSSAAVRRLPLVVHFHGPWADEAALQGQGRGRAGIKRAVERAYYGRAARAIVLSETFARLLRERYGVPASRIMVIPPGVDLQRFRPGPRDEARRALGLPEDAFVVVAARRLVRRMGLDLLLEAWAKVVTGDAPALLVIVGDGPERSPLEHLARDLGIARSVHFAGRVSAESLVTNYQAADLSVIPSVALEGFGLAMLESLACGTPVVVTDACGSAPIVAAMDPSCVVPAGDVDALASRLVRAVSTGVVSADQCRRVAETFSWAATAQAHRALYDTVVAMPRPLRVVYIDHCSELSGAEITLLRLLPALAGIEPYVVLAADGPLADRLRTSGIEVEIMELAPSTRNLRRGRVSLRTLPIGAAIDASTYTVRLARRLRRLRPDIVHTNSLKAAVYGGLAGRLAGVPVVWHLHDRIADDYLPRFAVRLIRALARWIPSGVIANSDATLSTLGPPPAVAAVVASPVARVRDGPRPLRPVIPRSLRVGMVGRLAPWKGQHVFLEAAALAFPAGDVQVVVVGAPLFGEDAYELELRQLVARLGTESWVDFAGFQEDVDAILDDLDVLVHASLVPEPFGLVVAEGMAAGIAVVAADAGGPAEMIEHGRSGLLFPPGDAVALARLLRQVAADAELRAGLGAQARLDARRFLPLAVQADVVDVYRHVLRRRRSA